MQWPRRLVDSPFYLVVFLVIVAVIAIPYSAYVIFKEMWRNAMIY